MCSLYSNQQHSISVTEETVFVFNGLFVSFHRQIVACKCANHDQEAGFWQMKIGNECIRNIELIRWMDKSIRPSFRRFKQLFCSERRFQGAHGSGTNGTNAVSADTGLIHDSAGFLIHAVILGIHLMFAEVFHFNRTESAKPCMQGGLRETDPFYFKSFDK